MDLEANQSANSEKSEENKEKLDENINAVPQLLSEVKEEMNEVEDNEDILDIDLSTVEIASSLLNENFSLNPELEIPDDSMNENYKNILTACSSTAQSIKQAISDVLNSREKVVITEVDPTAELQESLNKKIADFENTIKGTFASSSTVTNSVAEKEVGSDVNSMETMKELSKGDANLKDSVTQINMEQVTNPLIETSTNSAVLSNEKEEVKIATTMDLKEIDKKIESESLEMNPQDAQTILSSQLQVVEEMLKNTVSTDDEKVGKKQKNFASKKKGEKNIDQILKTLGNGSAEDKLHKLTKKHMETLEELRLLDPRLKQLERQVISQQREKEQLQAEHNRMILAKSRLEGLCREMQRQSKAVKEESLLRIKEEEEKRKEIANKFQSTLNDISSLMQENSEKNSQLREENTILTGKLKSLVDNYEVWEQNMSKIVQQKELETQLAKAKHAKANLFLKQETEKFLREKQSLLENLSELQKRCALLATNELQLRTELADYTSKYEEFQNVLSNSSKVFATFKTDMESTSKKIKKLEKETNVYKQKWESSNNALLDMISHKEKQDKEVANAQQRIQLLEKLCRALQAERNELQNQLKIATSNTASSSSNDVPSPPTEAGVA